MSSCVFCKIISGEIPAKKVFEDDLVVVIEDISPAAPTHLLILPKKHIASVLELTEAENLLIGHIHRVASGLAVNLGFAESGFRIVINTNGDGGQTVFHLHYHVLAGRGLTWPPG